MRVGLIVLVEVPDTVDVLELLMDDVIVGVRRIVNVGLEVTVIVNRALAVLVALVEADTVRDTRTLGELLGLDVTVLVACLEALIVGEELPVLLDTIVLVPLTLAVAVFEDIDVRLVVGVNLIVLDIADVAVYEEDPEEVLEGLIDTLEVPLTVEVLDTGAERDSVADELEVLEVLIDAVVVLLTVTVRVDVEEAVLVFVENSEIDISGLDVPVLECVGDRVVVIVDVIVLVEVPDSVVSRVGHELRVLTDDLVDVLDDVGDNVGTAKFTSSFLLYMLVTSTTDSLGGDDPMSPMLNKSRNQRIFFYILVYILYLGMCHVI